MWTVKGKVHLRCSNKHLHVLSFTKIRKANSSAAHIEPLNRLRKLFSGDNDNNSPESKLPAWREKQKIMTHFSSKLVRRRLPRANERIKYTFTIELLYISVKVCTFR